MTTSPPLFRRVVVDYGHGGLLGGVYQTPGGKQYRHTAPRSGAPFWIGEGCSNRETAWRLMRLLRAQGMEVWDALTGRQVVTPPNSAAELEQRDVSLSARVATTKKLDPKTTLLVSLHSNAQGEVLAGPGQKARGIDIYTSRGQTRSDAVATSLYNAFAAEMGKGSGLPMRKGDFSDGDVDHEADFQIVKQSPCPAVLGEIGFFTNEDDACFLLSSAGQDRIAAAYVAGICPWLA